jgi:IS4 transposase
MMLYAVIMRFDSLCDIEASMLAEVRKLAHVGLETVPRRSTLADVNARRSEKFFEDGMKYREQVVVFRKGEISHIARIITYVDIKKGRQPKLVRLLTNDFDMSLDDIVQIYRRRWQTESLFKQIKQNIPLRYFYGESANAVKIQIWVTLIANLLMTMLQRRLERPWSFSGLATMVRIVLMYYINQNTFFEKPDEDLKRMLREAAESPPKGADLEK